MVLHRVISSRCHVEPKGNRPSKKTCTMEVVADREIVRQCEQNRLAMLAMAIRQFEHQKNRWPDSLDELAEIGIDLEDLQPASDQPFGYRIEADGGAVVWGIPDTLTNEIPTEPSPVVGNLYEENIDWVWRLHKR